MRLTQAERRSQLLDAARTEFLSRGYAGTRLQAVAKACGVTEPMVYKHFESKDELFDAAIMQPLHDLLQERIAEILAMPADPAGAVQLETTRAFLRTLVRTFAETVHPIGMVLFGEATHADNLYRRHLRPLIDAAVQASEATWSTWPHRDYDIRTAMNAAFGMAFWAALTQHLDRTGTDLDAVADQLGDILFNGLKATNPDGQRS